LTKQLTEAEFGNTFGSKMTDVTQTAEPVVDIWGYVEELVKQKLVDNENGRVYQGRSLNHSYEMGYFFNNYK
jgi:hypothetical protein